MMLLAPGFAFGALDWELKGRRRARRRAAFTRWPTTKSASRWSFLAAAGEISLAKVFLTHGYGTESRGPRSFLRRARRPVGVTQWSTTRHTVKSFCLAGATARPLWPTRGYGTEPTGLRSSLTLSPPARLRQGMSYDVAHRQVVLFGGSNVGFAEFSDTWVWDGNAWTQKFPSVSPPASSDQVMSFDATRNAGSPLLAMVRGCGTVARGLRNSLR